MKRKTIKYLIWIILGMITLYFVVSKNGNLALDGGGPQLASTLYAIFASIAWGAYRLIAEKRSAAYLAAIILYASIFVVMFLTGYVFSPTQMVAVIALFYYSSKIFAYTFKT